MILRKKTIANFNVMVPDHDDGWDFTYKTSDCTYCYE